mmetsp:Transcript_23298/g.58877  ORF Transcript_23298/g.58877 Transcript_23298/m.58877 type:complete len:276 (+) Transcript_23298:2218-3045(+)
MWKKLLQRQGWCSPWVLTNPSSQLQENLRMKICLNKLQGSVKRVSRARFWTRHTLLLLSRVGRRMQGMRPESQSPSPLTQQSETRLQIRFGPPLRRCLPKVLVPLVSTLAGSCCARRCEVCRYLRPDSPAPSRQGHCCSETLRNGSQRKRNASRPSKMPTGSSPLAHLPPLVLRPLHAAQRPTRHRTAMMMSQLAFLSRAKTHASAPLASGPLHMRPLQHLLSLLRWPWCALHLNKVPEQRHWLMRLRAKTFRPVHLRLPRSWPPTQRRQCRSRC